MSYASWSRENFLRPWLPVRAWRNLLLLVKSTRFNLRRNS